jgi:hypothetical protein
MKPLHACAISLLWVVTVVTAGASSELSGAPPTPANRIVGLWATEGHAGPCGEVPVATIRNTLIFQAGGTVVENPRALPGGVPSPSGLYQRSIGLGTWSYDPVANKYYLYLQFDNYVDNVYNGFTTVDREISLSSEGLLASGPVRIVRYKADGSPLAELCGEVLSTRL